MLVPAREQCARDQTDGPPTHASGHPRPRSSLRTEKMKPFRRGAPKGNDSLGRAGERAGYDLGAILVVCGPGTEIQEAAGCADPRCRKVDRSSLQCASRSGLSPEQVRIGRARWDAQGMVGRRRRGEPAAARTRGAQVHRRPAFRPVWCAREHVSRALLANDQHSLSEGKRCPAGRVGVALAGGSDCHRSGSNSPEASVRSATGVIPLLLDSEDGGHRQRGDRPAERCLLVWQLDVDPCADRDLVLGRGDARQLRRA